MRQIRTVLATIIGLKIAAIGAMFIMLLSMGNTPQQAFGTTCFAFATALVLVFMRRGEE